MSRVKRLAVTGGTGFLGGHLVERLAREGVPHKILSRKSGDLRDRSDVSRFLRDCDAVVNLADSAEWSEEDTKSIAENLASEAISQGIARFVHISTAAVVGRSDAEWIDERTMCRPAGAYELRKLRFEQELEKGLAGQVDLVVLRPTAVFGPGGRNGRKIADDLRRDPAWKRSLRWSLLKHRRLNLVAVSNVVEAIVFALNRESPFGIERFIVSDDDDPLNNYDAFAAALAERLRIDFHPMTLPLIDRLLPLMLRLRGRALTNPNAHFSSAKLRGAGFRPPIGLREELDRFASALPA